MKRKVEEVFVTEGVPVYTFIPPPNFNDILLDVRREGKPVIIEGQSGTGKTTCIKKILENIGIGASVTYLTARKPEDVQAITELINKPTAGTFVVDDFHWLDIKIRTALADIAKRAAETADYASKLPKLVLIGINQIGSDLIQLVPDIAKRSGIHCIKPGTEDLIRQLIRAGCVELNVNIEGEERIHAEARGDYWLTQQLCQQVCLLNDVLETVDLSKQLGFDIDKLRQKVVGKLQNGYHSGVKEFCRGQRFRPSNDPYFKLLRAIGQQERSVVDLNELANSNDEVRGSINNIKETRLPKLLMDKPQCGRLFYYNPESKNFAVEDPALFYFLKHLDWSALRLECGFRDLNREYAYDIALSFAGENRELARHIANQLGHLDVRVFFDEHFETNFLGKTWSNQFKEIFGETSRFVVCLLDAHHKNKLWPTFERDCFNPRVPAEEVFPIFLDDTAFPGIPKDLVGIKFVWDQTKPDWQTMVDDQIVRKLIDRIG